MFLCVFAAISAIACGAGVGITVWCCRRWGKW